jgi:hypothetical protein
MYVYVLIHTHTHTQTNTHIYIHTCITYANIRMCVLSCTPCICCMYVCMYICIYTCIHTYKYSVCLSDRWICTKTPIWMNMYAHTVCTCTFCIRVYVYVYVCVWVCVCVCACVSDTFLHVDFFVYVRMYGRMYVCLYTYENTYTCTHTCACLHVFYAHQYIYIYIYIYVYIYICIMCYVCIMSKHLTYVCIFRLVYVCVSKVQASICMYVSMCVYKYTTTVYHLMASWQHVYASLPQENINMREHVHACIHIHQLKYSYIYIYIYICVYTYMCIIHNPSWMHLYVSVLTLFWAVKKNSKSVFVSHIRCRPGKLKCNLLYTGIEYMMAYILSYLKKIVHTFCRVKNADISSYACIHICLHVSYTCLCILKTYTYVYVHIHLYVYIQTNRGTHL